MKEPELTDEERARLRKMLDQDEKVAWLWALARKLATWILGVAAALVAFRDDVSVLIAWMFDRGE